MVARNSIHIDGRLGTASPERFSVGLHYALVGGGGMSGSADLQAWVDEAAGLWGSASVSLIKGALGTSSAITGMRAYYYPASGPAVLSASASVGSGGAGSGSPVHPFQIARVTTLQTGEAGRSARGRVYWPALTHAVDPATGQSLPPSGYAAAWAAVLTIIRDSAPGAIALEPVVYSSTQNRLTEVSSVRVGSVLDTQRRRRDSLLETYEQVALT